MQTFVNKYGGLFLHYIKKKSHQVQLPLDHNPEEYAPVDIENAIISDFDWPCPQNSINDDILMLIQKYDGVATKLLIPLDFSIFEISLACNL